jgi:hypothetical protein
MEDLSQHGLQAHALAKVYFQGRRPFSSEVVFGLGDTLLPVRECSLWLVGRGQDKDKDRMNQLVDIYPVVVVVVSGVVVAGAEEERA